MSSESKGSTAGNIVLLVLLLAITLFTAYQEGYFKQIGTDMPFLEALTSKISLNLWAAVIGGYLLAIWLSVVISTRRLLALIFVIFIVEYAKETIGVNLGLWTYTAGPDKYLFGVWLWVLAGITTYTIATRVVIKLTNASSFTWPRWINPIVIIVIFLVIPITLGNSWKNVGIPTSPQIEKNKKTNDAGKSGEISATDKSAANPSESLKDDQMAKKEPYLKWKDCLVKQNLFWVFYGLLFIFCIFISLAMDIRTLFGFLISIWIVGTISEHLGPASKIWTFDPKQPAFVPSYLIFGCWPLEILFQVAVSALLAREPIAESPNPRKKLQGNGPPDDSGTAIGTNSNSESSGDHENEPSTPAQGNPRSSTKSMEALDRLGLGGGCGHEDIELTIQERAFKAFMLLSALLYLVFGFVFLLAPDYVTNYTNSLIEIFPGLSMKYNKTPLLAHKFYVSLAFSMMMCITVLSFLAQYNVRRNKNYVVPLLFAKKASYISALFIFVLSLKYFSYMVIFVVDGVLFWITLAFFLNAQQSFFEEQTTYFWKDLEDVNVTGQHKVASHKGDDKFELLYRVLNDTKFDDLLKHAYAKSTKAKDKFSVVIKPNFMFTHSNKDISTYTDPALVEALVDRIESLGFTNIAIVEAQSTLGNYYDNRDVLSVARHVGYSTDKNYRIVDLTEEMEEYDYGGRLGWHYVGPTWRDADFRISFAKNKTHTFCYYTLTLKNIYGTLPCQNKLKVYHTVREYDWPTIESMKCFPVHYGIIDAFYSADGQFGVMCDPYPNFTQTIIGGDNLMAVDWVGSSKMGLDPCKPRVGRFLYLAMKAFGKPQISWLGDKTQYEPWDNVSPVYVQSLDLIEEAYHFSNWSFSITSACDKAFPIKHQPALVTLLRYLAWPIKRYWYRYDAV